MSCMQASLLQFVSLISLFQVRWAENVVDNEFLGDMPMFRVSSASSSYLLEQVGKRARSVAFSPSAGQDDTGLGLLTVQ
jgi:hypothetical protein